MIIDFHAHLDDRWFDQPLMSRDQFVAALDRCGVDAACVFTLMGFFQDSRKHNDLLAERAAALPTRLIPFITVDPKLGDASIEELKRCIAMNVFRGIKLHPWLQAFAPSMVKTTLVGIAKIAAENGLSTHYVALMQAVQEEAERVSGKSLPINATGAIGAIAAEFGFPWKIIRGFGVMARAIGLVGHILEEIDDPMAIEIWQRVEKEAGGPRQD